MFNSEVLKNNKEISTDVAITTFPLIFTTSNYFIKYKL